MSIVPETERLIEASAVWARGGGHDHRSIAAQFRECGDTLRRELAGEEVKPFVDESIADLEACEDW